MYLCAFVSPLRANTVALTIAVAAALLSMGPALATSIDGGWLRRLADAAGEELVDDVCVHELDVARACGGSGAAQLLPCR